MSTLPTLCRRLGILVLVCATTVGCGSKFRDCNDKPSAEDATVDPALMAFLSRAKAAHHEADLYDADPQQCLRPLLALVDGPLPGSAAKKPPEVREVLADTEARIAELESQLGRFDSAKRRIEQALLLVPDVSYFRGHLFETRGLVEQRWAEALSKQELTEQAKAAKARALEAFEAAMEVQAAVIRNAKPLPPPPTTERNSQ